MATLSMRVHTFFALALFSSSLAAAQVPPSPPDANRATAPDAAFTIERIHTKLRFENDGTGQREQTIWVKVLDEQAVRQFGELAFAYQSDTEDLVLADIGVQKPDGAVVPTAASAVQDLSAVPAGQVPIFVDLRQKLVSVFALRPGDVLRATARWTIKKPIAPGHFWFEHAFEKAADVRDEQLEIDVPASRAAAIKTVKDAAAEEHGGSGEVRDGRRIYRWHTSHTKTAADAAATDPGADAPPADVRLSSFRNWDEFAAWFSPLGFAKPDAAVKARTDALTAGLKDEAAKIAAIYRFVSTEIRYVSLSFGLGRFAAHAPADVLKTQYGDCKDKAVLLQSMLAAAGVPSATVLVNVTRSIADDFASPLEFNHMIAVIPRSAGRDRDIWMDATLEVAPLGLVGPTTRDRMVLQLAEHGRPAVARVPADPPFPSVTSIALDGTVNPIGVLTGTVTVTARGDGELLQRTLVRTVPRTMLKDIAAEIVSATGITAEVSDVTTSDAADTSGPFRLTFAVRGKGFLDWAAARSTLKVPIKVPLPYTSADARKDITRIRLGSPDIEERHVRVTLPEGYEVTAPQPVAVSRAGVSYTADYKAAGRQIAVDRFVKTSARDVPATAFGEYAAIVSAIDADIAQAFAVRGTSAGMPVVPADATSAELYAAGQSAWRAKRYDAAAALYKRDTEVSAKDEDAWIALGLAYGRLQKYDEAAASIQKAIGLNPLNKRAYGDLGFVLKEAGRRQEAIRAYTRHTELNALDGEAFKELGMLHRDENRDADAVAPLEQAARLLPRDAWVHANLLAAYLKTKQPDKARKAVDAALDAKPDVEVREYLAWHLADNGVDLERAAELAAQAEKELEAEMRGVSLDRVTAAQLDHADRLGWVWDALGWINFQRGQLEAAEKYVRSAWQFLGEEDPAFHLGRIFEKRGRRADAMSFYLTAQAIAGHPTDEMIASAKKYAGGGDMKLMLDLARQAALAERVVRVSIKGSGTADFLVIVDETGKPVDVRFVNGSEALKAAAETALRAVQLPLVFPTSAPHRLPVGVRVACSPAGQCIAALDFPHRLKAPEPVAK